jgi:hypothetical protein
MRNGASFSETAVTTLMGGLSMLLMQMASTNYGLLFAVTVEKMIGT